MLLVVASPWDEAARALVDRWEPHGAGLLSVSDLSRAGWRHYPGDPGRSRAVVDGKVVATSDISGVLTRLPAITEQEIPHIVPEDRSYAATEMTAFLTFWLSTLKCPVLNRPSASSLCGPSWRSEQWTLRASRLGLPVAPRHRHTPPFGAGTPTPGDGSSSSLADADVGAVQVTVVGDRCVGAADEDLARQARLLAAAAGVDLLAVLFSVPESGSRFVDAHLWVNLYDEEVDEALLHYFFSMRTQPSSPEGGRS